MSENTTVIKDETTEPTIEPTITAEASAPAVSTPEMQECVSSEAAPPVQESPFQSQEMSTHGTIFQSQGTPVQEPAPQPQAAPAQEASMADDELPDDPEEEKPKRHFFPFRSAKSDFSRDEWILSHIDSTQLMEYLTLEQKRFEQLQEAKERKERRIYTAFKLTVSLAAIVAVIYLLKDVPTILVNILYIAGILAALWFWKNPRDKKDK